ncbi:hypothetical protein Moror_13883 [Moniliophthora roreri MCA 2997]|uniref:Uncharacterized protein n=1 Tax=Moniliophthora roreri (strain MCA 2997) TaxID=1381753 RepID=V2XQP5_MONRO|nr:hypothetical protein Moror_13883 [Moniliophthora roreri MCA 2997]
MGNLRLRNDLSNHSSPALLDEEGSDDAFEEDDVITRSYFASVDHDSVKETELSSDMKATSAHTSVEKDVATFSFVSGNGSVLAKDDSDSSADSINVSLPLSDSIIPETFDSSNELTHNDLTNLTNSKNEVSSSPTMMILSDALSRISLAEGEARPTSRSNSKSAEFTSSTSSDQKLSGLSVVTYADARNVAHRYPELAATVLSRPLPDHTTSATNISSTKVSQSPTEVPENPILAVDAELPVAIQKLPTTSNYSNAGEGRRDRTGNKPTRRSSRRRRKRASGKGKASDDGMSTEGSSCGKRRHGKTSRCASAATSRPHTPAPSQGLSSSRWAVRPSGNVAEGGPCSVVEDKDNTGQADRKLHCRSSSSLKEDVLRSAIAHPTFTELLDSSHVATESLPIHPTSHKTFDDATNALPHERHVAAKQCMVSPSPVSAVDRLHRNESISEVPTHSAKLMGTTTAQDAEYHRVSSRDPVIRESGDTLPTASQLQEMLRRNLDYVVPSDNVTYNQGAIPKPVYNSQQQFPPPFISSHTPGFGSVQSTHAHSRATAEAVRFSGHQARSFSAGYSSRKPGMDVDHLNGVNTSAPTIVSSSADPLMIFWQRIHDTWGELPGQQSLPPLYLHETTSGINPHPSHPQPRTPVHSYPTVPHTVELPPQPTMHMQDGWLIPPQYVPGPRSRALRHTPSQIIHRQPSVQFDTRMTMGQKEVRRTASISVLPHLQHGISSPTPFVTPTGGRIVNSNILPLPHNPGLRIPFSASSEAGFHNNPPPPQIMAIPDTANATLCRDNVSSSLLNEQSKESSTIHRKASPGAQISQISQTEDASENITPAVDNETRSDSPRSSFSSRRPSRSAFERPLVRIKPEEVLSWRTPRTVSGSSAIRHGHQKYVPPPVAQAKGLTAKDSSPKGRNSLRNGPPRVDTSRAIRSEDLGNLPGYEQEKENITKGVTAPNESQSAVEAPTNTNQGALTTF